MISNGYDSSTTFIWFFYYVVPIAADGYYLTDLAFSLPQPDRSAYRTDAYGYSRMTIYNRTHLFWEQVQCDSSEVPVLEGVVVDSAWIVQNNHGSFADRAARAKI